MLASTNATAHLLCDLESTTWNAFLCIGICGRALSICASDAATRLRFAPSFAESKFIGLDEAQLISARTWDAANASARIASTRLNLPFGGKKLIGACLAFNQEVRDRREARMTLFKLTPTAFRLPACQSRRREVSVCF